MLMRDEKKTLTSDITYVCCEDRVSQIQKLSIESYSGVVLAQLLVRKSGGGGLEKRPFQSR